MVSFHRIILVLASALASSSAFSMLPSTSSLWIGPTATTHIRTQRNRSNLSVLSIPVEADTCSQTQGETVAVSENSLQKTQEKTGLLARAFRSVSGKKLDRTTIAKLSSSVLPSYVLVGSSFAAVAISCAWYIASRSSGLSPLAPGQLRAFLKVYAGFYAFLNLIKPLRLMLAIYVARYFERGVIGMQTRLQCSKPKAVGIMFFLTNVCGGMSLLTGGIFTASALSGVPIFA